MVWPPEIDVFEILGQTPSTMYSSTHDSATNHTATVSIPDSSADFHVYGADWEPTNIVYYVDGVPAATWPTAPDMTNPMYIIADLAVGTTDSWVGPPNSSTVFPANMYIDYIRAYTSPASTNMGAASL